MILLKPAKDFRVTYNDFKLSRSAFEVGQKFEAVPRE